MQFGRSALAFWPRGETLPVMGGYPVQKKKNPERACMHVRVEGGVGVRLQTQIQPRLHRYVPLSLVYKILATASCYKRKRKKKKKKKREKKRHACTIALCVEKGYVVCLNNVKKQQHEVGKQNPRIIDNLSLCEAVAL